jgi:hypothetical protein
MRFLLNLLCLIVSRRVSELEHELADSKFALHMAEHAINDLKAELLDCRSHWQKAAPASDSWE